MSSTRILAYEKEMRDQSDEGRLEEDKNASNGRI